MSQAISVFSLPASIVNQIVAGAGISVAPVGGTGIVTVSSTVTPGEFPTKTFFVSPTFSGISPFFSTIQAAINAANGVDVTLIWIYPGIYLEVLTLKHNVFLRGTDKKQVFIGDNASALIVGAPAFSTNFTCGIRDVTLTSTHATTTGISITPAVGGVLTMYMLDVDILLQFGNSAGFIFTNSTAANNSHLIYITNCNFNVNGSSGALYLSKPPNNVFINGCSFGGSAKSILCDSISGVFNLCNVVNSGFNSDPQVNGGSAMTWTFHGCSFTCTFTNTGGFGNDTIFFRECLFNGALINVLSAATETWNFYNCTFRASGNDAVIVEVEDIDPRFRFYNCVFENGRIHFTVANVKFIFVNTVVRNSTGTNAISTISTPTVFLGNFTSDKVLQAGVAQAAGSFNVQTSVAI